MNGLTGCEGGAGPPTLTIPRTWGINLNAAGLLTNRDNNKGGKQFPPFGLLPFTWRYVICGWNLRAGQQRVSAELTGKSPGTLSQWRGHPFMVLQTQHDRTSEVPIAYAAMAH